MLGQPPMNAPAQQWVAFVVMVLALAVVVGGVWFMLFGARPSAAAPTEEFSAITDQDTERIARYQEPRFKLLVVAGTYRQFEEYCAELGLNRFHDAVYMDSVRKVQGWRDQKYVLVGTWWERSDLAELRKELALRGCTLI